MQSIFKSFLGANRIMMTKRFLSVQPITKRIRLITGDITKKDVKNTQRNGDKRSLALIITWLLSTPRQQSKFTQIYLDQGFDVLVMETNLIDSLWPTTGAQKVSRDVLEYLAKSNNNYDKMVIHGFSAGGYLWGECLRHWENNQSRYQPVMDRIAAQTWDSIAGMTEVPVGMSITIFPKNKLMQKLTEKIVSLYLKIFNEAVTRHYVKSQDLFHAGIVKAPALFFVSKSDHIGPVSLNRRIADCWMKAGVDVTWKCFDSSPHVGHFVKHRDEYLKCLYDHLKKVDLMKK